MASRNRRAKQAILLLALAAARIYAAADCVLDGNPTCAAASNLGQIAGDAGAPTITRTGVGEAFFTVRLSEDASSTRDLTAAVRLQVPSGTNYNLIVRCESCASAATKAYTGRPGQNEEVRLSRRDDLSDNSFLVVVEVRYRQGRSCAPWILTVVGNTGAGSSPLVCS